MSRSKSAIAHLRRTGNVEESLDVVLGRRAPENLDEGGGPATQQTQDWFLPTQDALQQFILRLMDKLPDATYEVSDFTNGSQGGYKVSVSGVFMAHDLASLAAVKGGVTPLHNLPASP